MGPRTSNGGRLPVLDQALEAGDGRRGTNARVVVEDPGHPAAGDGWPEVEVSRSLVPVDADTGRTILALEDGRPLLVEHTVGRGRLLVLYTALDREWTSLVVRPAFVRLVSDALRYLGNDPGALQAVAGEAVSVPASSVQFFDADGARVLGLASTTRRPTVRFGEAGFYSAHTPGRRALVAVNVDPRESDLRPADPAVLARWQEAAGAVPAEAPPHPLSRGPVPDPGCSRSHPGCWVCWPCCCSWSRCSRTWARVCAGCSVSQGASEYGTPDGRGRRRGMLAESNTSTTSSRTSTRHSLMA